MTSLSADRPRADRLRALRQHWLETGRFDESPGDRPAFARPAGFGMPAAVDLPAQGLLTSSLLTPGLRASWRRSQALGLRPEGRGATAPHASAAQLARALEQRQALLAQARPVMAFLAEQIQGSDSLVLLADAEGMLLAAQGDARFGDRAARVALRPGAIWSEQWRGTNAIGTALAEAAPVVVHGAEHYLDRNAFLACTAAPICDARGQVLGVLDISGERRGLHRPMLSMALGLVRTAVCMIEHQLLRSAPLGCWRLQVHAQAEGLGSLTEGLLLLDEAGLLAGANSAALEALGLPRSAIGRLGLADLFGPALRRDGGTAIDPIGAGAFAGQHEDLLAYLLRQGLGRPVPLMRCRAGQNRADVDGPGEASMAAPRRAGPALWWARLEAVAPAPAMPSPVRPVSLGTPAAQAAQHAQTAQTAPACWGVGTAVAASTTAAAADAIAVAVATTAAASVATPSCHEVDQRAAAAAASTAAPGAEVLPADLAPQPLRIAQAIDGCGGNVSAAARQLGISRATLYRQLGRARAMACAEAA